MSIEQLTADQRVMQTEYGQVLGCSYRWPGGQYCAIHTDRGLLGCGLFDCGIASRFGYAIAIARGTPAQPLCVPEDLLQAKIAEVSQLAAELGIEPGMTGLQALQCLLSGERK
jgi:uncharacterized protein YunC (DUF1805 family)